jgi:tyrosyl-tRNA synthetase
MRRVRDTSIAPVTDPASFLLRNAVDALPKGELERKLDEGRPLRVKLGIDPTAPDIHLGHTVVLRKLREFQDLGHVVVLIVGDYTARVGDPSGRSALRPQLDAEEIDRNAETFQQQAYKILDRDKTEVRRNSEWLDMPMDELFGVARTATVAQLLERDDFAKRYSAGTPISILELLYPLLQGYDSVQVRSDVELGGTDQTFNLLLAREIQKAYGVPPQVALTMPILPGTDGTQRMGKSVGNYIGVTEPAEEIFGKAMSLPDEAMPVWYDLLLDREPDADRHPAELKRELARSLASQYGGGEEAGARAEEHFNRVHVAHELPEEVEDAPLPDGDPVHLPEALASAFGISRSEARRLLAGGGVKVDGEPLDGGRLDVPANELEGRVIQLGKRRFKRMVAAADTR